MRRAFAACVAFAILVVIAAVRCGHKATPPAAVQPSDAAVAIAPLDAGVAIVDAPPPPKKHGAKPAPKPTATHPKPAPKPTVKPAPTPASVFPPQVFPTQVAPGPVRRQCTQPPNPVGCPMTEPNINHPCDSEGVHCVYGTSCCPPVYVCTNGAYEAWFSHCP